MKVSDIKANGVSYYTPAKSSIPTIETAIGLYKMRFTEDEILDKFDQTDQFYTGVRYNDNNAVAIRIAGAITKTAISKTGTNDELILEGYIKAFVDSLSGSEMDIIILDGLSCCASADHWYTFEKEWS